MFCKYWKELDGDDGKEYEFCRLEFKKCNCCGDTKQCSFKWAIEKEKEKDN